MNEKEKEVSTAQERTRDDHISDIVFEDIKTITKCIQNMIKMIETYQAAGMKYFNLP